MQKQKNTHTHLLSAASLSCTITSCWCRLIHPARILKSMPMGLTFITTPFTFHLENQGELLWLEGWAKSTTLRAPPPYPQDRIQGRRSQEIHCHLQTGRP